jgi:hypothetical protein
MKIVIVYALQQRQVSLTVDLPDGATIKDAIERSGILEKYREIDLKTQKVGVYGKISKLDAVLTDGDRIEIYRPITADPKTVRRKNKSDDSSEG